MIRVKVVVVVLLVIVGAWMVFDGAHALVTGDYVTPSSGPHAGRLGPWSALVEAVGIEARSTPMMLGFVVIGSLHLLAAVSLALGVGPTGWIVGVAALSGLWYLPFGTVADGIVLILIVSWIRPW